MPGFFGVMKKYRDFLGYQLKSTTFISASYCLCWIFFLVCQKKAGIFLGRQILKLGFFLV